MSQWYSVANGSMPLARSSRATSMTGASAWSRPTSGRMMSAISSVALGSHVAASPIDVGKAVKWGRYLVTETRLKIPAIFHNEAMSGVDARRPPPH